MDRTPLGKIAFIGGGNMATALVSGLARAGLAAAEDVTVSDVSADRREALARDHGVGVTGVSADAVRGAAIVVLAVKPQVMAVALAEIAGALPADALVVSVAAGVPTAAIEAALAPGQPVVRAMPNTPCLVQAGITALAPGRHATEAHLALATSIFAAVGRTVTLGEGQLDAVTGLSGSGPAYVYLMIEALSDGGVRMGLPRDVATLLAAQTVHGAAHLMLESGRHAAELRDAVTSPGGTTIAGLHALEKAGTRAAFIGAVEAATLRSAELGAAARKG